MKSLLLASVISVLAASVLMPVKGEAQTKLALIRKWQTPEGLNTPESVWYDNSRSVLYISNINGKTDGTDKKGFISKVKLDGTFDNLNWVTGLGAPKGLGVIGDKLYAADVTYVDVIDIPSGKLESRIPVPGAVFLNDITVDHSGDVYISDTKTGKIHVLKAGKISLYYQGDPLKGPNGLLCYEDKFYVLDSPTGVMYRLDPKNKLVKVADIAPGADGLVPVGNGSFLASNWNGEVYYVDANGTKQKILDTKEQKLNTADIEYFRRGKVLYVPTFFGNSVVAYDLKTE